MEWRSIASNSWVDQDARDAVIQFVPYWTSRSGVTQSDLLRAIGISRSRFNEWSRRFSLPNQHHQNINNLDLLTEAEEQAVVKYARDNLGEGYRRLCYMMMDEDVAYLSPSSVYRILKKHALIKSKTQKTSLKGTGFKQPSAPHQHWHTDITFIKIRDKIYCLLFVLDGYSRAILSYGLYEDMSADKVTLVIQKAKELYPQAKARIISDNGRQYLGKELKTFITQNNLTHVTTSPYYPQSNGKLERFHGTIKQFLRTRVILDLEDANNIINQYILYYNHERLHSAIGYVTPEARLLNIDQFIHEVRDHKLQNARSLRKETNKIKFDKMAA